MIEFAPAPEALPVRPQIQRRLGTLSMVGEGDYGDRPIVVQENLNRLEMAGEVGQHLIPTYLAALVKEPALEGVIIKPYQSSDIKALNGTPGGARAPYDSESGRPEVFINITGWGEYSRLLKDRGAAVVEIARKLGANPDQIDAKTFAQFTLLHELGHTKDFIDKAFDRDAIDGDERRGLDTLPMPGLSPSLLITWARRHPFKAKKHMKTHKAHLDKLGIGSVKELIVAQETAYRNIPTEAVADQFAVEVMKG